MNTTTIRFLGLAAFEITLPSGQVVLMDPCLDEKNPASPVKVADLKQVDLLLVSHLAVDHATDAAAVAKKFGCPVVCGPEVRYSLLRQGVDAGQIRTVPWHGQVNPLGIRVRSIPSMHGSTGIAPDGQYVSGMAMGFILYAADNCRIYHSGDTSIYSDLRLVGELYRPDVGLMCACELEQEYLQSLGLKDHYGNEMSGDQGALAATWLGVKYAICCHFLNPEGRDDVQKFVATLKANEGPVPIVLKPGETFVYPPQEG